MTPARRSIANQPSFVIRSRDVELAVTARGGHMAPVTFYRRSRRPVQPYYISPWQAERRKIDVPVLVPLRGDFFCMPFGGDNRWRGEDHVAHGEPATAAWTCQDAHTSGGVTCLTLSMRTRARAGTVAKNLRLVDGQNVVYVQHVLEGFRGRMPLGHHATLAVPADEGACRIATSPIRFGMTCPDLFSDPAAREYQSLAIGRRFRSLRKVPLLWKNPPYADCSAFPARRGFTDLLAVFARPRRRPAWTAATFHADGYLWFSLKDPDVLPATVLWMSNGGRHAAPWDGRNRCLGLEDVCAYFAHGLAGSLRKNLLNESGIPTAVELSPRRPMVVNYIEGVVRVPRGFRQVEAVEFAPGQATFVSVGGRKVRADVQHEFCRTGELTA